MNSLEKINNSFSFVQDVLFSGTTITITVLVFAALIVFAVMKGKKKEDDSD